MNARHDRQGGAPRSVLLLLVLLTAALGVLFWTQSRGPSPDYTLGGPLFPVPKDRIEGLEHGADDYIFKPFSIDELTARIRNLLEQRETEMVPLTQEINFLEDYLYLQKMRFGESLRVSMELEKAEKRMVIPLSLQMLVENAIKHNEASAGHPLSIEIRATDEQRIVISNTLQPKELPEKSPGLGIENLKKRLSFYTSEPMSVSNGPEKFTVTLPTLPL